MAIGFGVGAGVPFARLATRLDIDAERALELCEQVEDEHGTGG